MLRRTFIVILVLAQVALVGFVDLKTGYEVSVALFYYFPIAFAAWYLGLGWGLGVTLLCAVTWLWADVGAGHHYSHAWFAIEQAGMRVFGFSFVAFSFAYFRRSVEREKRKVQRLSDALPLCACCHRVRDARGEWKDFSAYLREDDHRSVEQRLCPVCAQAPQMTTRPPLETWD